jgi:hypothetical protein
VTFEAQARAVERALEIVRDLPEVQARVEAARDGASTSGEYYDGVKGAFADALRRGRLSREAEPALREAVRAIDEIFQSSHPQFYAGRKGEWVRLVVFGVVAGALHYGVTFAWLALPGGAWIDVVAGVVTLLAYRRIARHLGARFRSGVLAALPWCVFASISSLASCGIAALAAILGAWLYDRSSGLRW